MQPTRTIIPFALLLLLLGCADSTETPATSDITDESHDVDDPDSHEHDAEETTSEPAVENTEAAATPDADTQAAMDKPPETPAKPSHDYMELPDGLPGPITQAYDQIAAGAQNGDVMGLLNLAGISQEIAKQITEADSEKADEFYKQAAGALRAGMEKYPEELPSSYVTPVFFNEALALARGNDIEGSTKSIGDAILAGFSDMDALREAKDLEAVLASEGFADKLKQWEAAAIAKVAERAKEELANGTSFPFAFTLKDLDGKEHSLTDYKGKVVIVDVWGTWCPPCREEIPSFIKLQNELGEQGLQILGLNYEREETPEQDMKVATEFVKEFGVNYPCFLGDEETQAQIKDLQGFPTTLFIDKAGKVRLMVVGLHGYSFLKAIVSELLAEEAPAEEAAAKEAPAKEEAAAKEAPAKEEAAAKEAPAKEEAAAKEAPAKEEAAPKEAPAKEEAAPKEAPAKEEAAAKEAPAKEEAAK